jgi:hypothetical protein
MRGRTGRFRPPRTFPRRRSSPVTTFFANRDSNYDYRVSPDGRRLAWMASAGGRLTVHFRELDGGEVGVIDTPWR